MILTMKAKLIAGALVATALVVAFLWYRSSLIGHGRELERAANAAAVEQQNQKTAQREQSARTITEEKSHEIEKQRDQRSVDGDRARAVVQPVRLCDSAADRREVPRAADPAAATDGVAADSELPMRARDTDPAAADLPGDISHGLITLMEACQRDHDDAAAWRRWYAEQKSLAHQTPSNRISD